eukprot:8842350-Pyramimonas_sp.AAC.1
MHDLIPHISRSRTFLDNVLRTSDYPKVVGDSGKCKENPLLFNALDSQGEGCPAELHEIHAERRQF